MAAAWRLAWTHSGHGCVWAWVRVQDQQTDLVLQLEQHLGWEVSGGNEPLVLLQQLLLNLQTTTASKPISF